VQPQQTRLASPSCRTPPGQSAGTRQAHPGNNLKPRFRCHVVYHLDTSTAIHSRSPSWSPPDASPAPSPHRSPPRPLNQRSMRRFEASPRRATPKGQPSSAAQHRHHPRSPTHRGLLRSWHTRIQALLHRKTLKAIAWRLRSGSPWRDLPRVCCVPVGLRPSPVFGRPMGRTLGRSRTSGPRPAKQRERLGFISVD